VCDLRAIKTPQIITGMGVQAGRRNFYENLRFLLRKIDKNLNIFELWGSFVNYK
jgi:hypothetical protein